jgi:outer membrane protein
MDGRLFVLLFSFSILGCSTPFENIPAYRPAALQSKNDTQIKKTGIQKESSVQDDKSYCLEDCQKMALRNHRSLSIANLRVLVAKDNLREGWTNSFPKLSAEGRFEARNNDQGFSIGETRTTTGSRETGTARLSLLVPIYDFGKAGNLRDSLRSQIAIAELNAEKESQDLIFAVSQGYFRVLEAEKIRAVVKESIQVVEEQLRISQDFFKQGLVAKNDVLAIEVQLAQREQELIKAENNVHLAIATLNRLTGLVLNNVKQIQDVLELDIWNGKFQDVLLVAIEKRPDLQSLKRQIEARKAEYRSTRAGFFPNIFAFSDYNYSTDDSLLNQEWLSGGIGIQIPLFDGGSNYVKMQRKSKEIEQSIHIHDEQIDDIVLEVKKVYLEVREVVQQIPIAKKSIELAKENLRIISEQYTEGLVTSTDILIEEDRLAKARSNYYRSLYRYQQAYSKLKNVIGGNPP